MNYLFFFQYIAHEKNGVERAEFEPSHPTKYAFFFFNPSRVELLDSLNTLVYGHKMLRLSYQFTKIPNENITIPILIPLESKKNQVVSSKLIEAVWLTDGAYFLNSKKIPEHLLSSRKDLVHVSPPSFESTYYLLDNDKIFIGTNPQQPIEGNFLVEYEAQVYPSITIFGSLSAQKEIHPIYCFAAKPTLTPLENMLLLQKNMLQHLELIIYFGGSFILLNGILIFAIITRESFPPNKYQALWSKMDRMQRYDILFIPLILFIPNSHLLSAIGFSAFLISYLVKRILIKQSRTLLYHQRINLYR